MRIHHRKEAEPLQDGVNLASSIYFDWVTIIRHEPLRVFQLQVGIPKDNPKDYSFYEEIFELSERIECVTLPRHGDRSASTSANSPRTR